MHILAVTSFLFLTCLYLLSIDAFLVMAVIMAVSAGLLSQHNLKFIFIVFLCPLLALTSLNLYENFNEVKELRVDKIYNRNLVGTMGFKRFQVGGDIDDYLVGDILLGKLRLEKMERNSNGYLGKVTITAPKRRRDLLSTMRRLRDELSEEAIRVYGFDRGSLMASLALGYKEEMNRERKDAMKTMGIMHILSISGFHFALLDIALKKMKLGNSRFYFLGVYAFFVNSISGYRTLLTIIYKMVGLRLKKDADLVTGLFLAMFVQAFLKPYLIFSTGYLLTYLSTLGILLFHEPINRKLVHLPIFLRDSLSLTLAALSLSFPIILSLSPEFSLGVFAGNMILVPLYVITTYLSFIGIMIMKIPLLKYLLLPFIEVFFDLSYHMGTFLSLYALKISLENLLVIYVPVVLIIIILAKKGTYKGIIFVVIFILVLEMPLGTSLTVYNSYGIPYIRITQNFKNYDIMDYRVADKETISLREDQNLLLGNHFVTLSLGDKEREVPRIYIDGHELKLERTVEYFKGCRQERKYHFINERIMRIK